MRVLILCTGNSARSQMAEALLRHLSDGRIDVHSAGTRPQPEVHPMAKATLAERYSLASDDLFPKTLDRFIGQHWDYVITVCDSAAESCPVFPGHTERIHWSLPDPAAVVGAQEQRQAFEQVAADLVDRFQRWLALPAVSRRLEPGT